MLTRDHYRRQVHFHAAEFLGDRYRGESQLGRFAKHAECDPRSLLADRLEMRFHLIRPELVDRAGYCKVFFVQIFGRENFVGRAILNEERATFHLQRSCRGSSHHFPPGSNNCDATRANL